MTVEAQNPDGTPIVKSGPYNGNGVTTAFNYTFPITAIGEVKVVRQNADLTETVLVLTTDYTVTGAGNPAGGQVILNSGALLPAGAKLVLLLDMDFDQAVDYSNQGRIQLSLLEISLDKLTLAARQLREELLRAVTVDAFGTADITQLRTNINALAAIEAQVITVSNNIANVQTVAGISANVTTVAGIAANVTTVVNNIAAINTNSANIVAIQNAATNAANAATSATNAANSASAAATSATNAANSATAAQGSATSAAQEADAAALYAGQVQGNIIPVGSICFFAAATPPSGWLVCDGSAVTALYPELRSFLVTAGQPFGNNGTDPRLPDLRGEFIRGWDGGRGVDAGRVFGSAQGDTIEDHLHYSGVSTTSTAAHVYGANTSEAPGVATSSFSGVTTVGSRQSVTSGVRSDNIGGTSGVSAETRPRNVALLPCIKAFGQVDVTGAANLAELLAAIATQAEAEAGTNNTKLMTPLRAEQHMTANALGWGQTWQNVTASRVAGTSYQNTTDRPIMVATRTSGSGDRNLQVSVDGTSWVDVGYAQGGSGLHSVSFIVPPGHYYRISASGGTIASWAELR